ncbi:hypothetical protein TREMEDRAFT_66443 [Tremella mesenterica DSM 1558]|uniref:uncharacterized protein n=1 Tax=Tremella mesenterica (strain ATCC 24925 / CBS 8224 / DSM 1558 / NBRC 9311 / NRRL Y-6157 / RJB 2259-6 / UBC 559-6) TaxID=578456 RepID=UPI00032C7055|nr:uncharacterized protein TREMEDRAFT_66443 [Tremella mesenterica DSM 1558]EIW65532.1 hypothetical protein TREMEDRAFT_66443 [Tremella mesenterica DSM 1558]
MVTHSSTYDEVYVWATLSLSYTDKDDASNGIYPIQEVLPRELCWMYNVNVIMIGRKPSGLSSVGRARAGTFKETVGMNSRRYAKGKFKKKPPPRTKDIDRLLGRYAVDRVILMEAWRTWMGCIQTHPSPE